MFASSGNQDLVQWDIEGLRPISSLTLDSSVAIVSYVNEQIYCGLDNGLIIQVDPRIKSIVNKSEFMINQNLLAIGSHLGVLYSAGETGPCVFYEDFNQPRTKTSTWNPICDFKLHSTLPYSVSVGDESMFLTSDYKKISTIQTNHKSRKVCFDQTRPLLALGCKDGYVSIYRLPNNV